MSLLQTHLSDRARWTDDRGHPTPSCFAPPSAPADEAGRAAAEELAALTNGAALVDLTHSGVVAVGGEARIDFLHGLITNQIRNVSPQRAIHAALLTPQGRFLWEFSIIAGDGEELLLHTGPDRVGELAARLRFYLLRTRATITDRTAELGCLGVAGPGAHTALMAAFPHLADLGDAPPGAAFTVASGVHLWRDPRHEACGWRLCATADRLPELWERLSPHARPTGLQAWEHFRISRAIPRGGAELEPDHTLPLEAGLVELNAIDFRKGCYVGQETTARTHHRGTIKKRLFRLELNAHTPELHPGVPVLTPGGREAGILSSLSCLNEQCLGLAILRLEEVAHHPELLVGGVTARAIRPEWSTWE